MNYLTYGQRVILDGYLDRLNPQFVYDEDTCILIPTCAIIEDLACAALFDINAVADYMAEKGYSYHCIHADGVSGWLVQCPKGLDADEDEGGEE